MLYRISKVEYKNMNFVWVSKHYDFHLEGLCKFNNKLCKFKLSDNWDNIDLNTVIFYNIYYLDLLEKLEWLIRKKLFEICIGKHWTYPREDFTVNKHFYSKTLFKLYYIVKRWYKTK